jgi:hypothetical protein
MQQVDWTHARPPFSDLGLPNKSIGTRQISMKRLGAIQQFERTRQTLMKQLMNQQKAMQ